MEINELNVVQTREYLDAGHLYQGYSVPVTFSVWADCRVQIICNRMNDDPLYI